MQNNSGPKAPRNPLQPKGLGDAPVVWNSGMGDPTLSGASLADSAGFVNANLGVQLSVESANSIGSLYWQKDYDYNNDLYIKMTLFGNHSVGAGGEGWTLFLGSDTNNSRIADETGSINVFLCDNFYNDPSTDAVLIFVDGAKVGGEGSNYFTAEPLDDTQVRTFEVLYEHKTENVNYITVFMDGKYICKVDVGSWTPGGNYIGVTGSSSSDGNYVNNHYIKSMEIRSVVPWMSINSPTQE
jgi:hypothetical protein